jgi:Ca-activated chloride channel family protein
MKSGVIAITIVLILSAFVMAMDTMGVTDPHLDGDKAISPGLIYAEGKGSPDEAAISLTVMGDGDPFVTTFPQDVVFAIDSSGSMIWSDPQDKRKTATKYYVDQLDPTINERAAVVDFDDQAYLVPKPTGDHLSTNYGKIKSNIDLIDSIGGTDIPGAMTIANSELINYGLASNIWIILLLTDGQNYCYEPPYWGTPCPRLDGLMDDENDPLVKQAIVLYSRPRRRR